MIEHHVCLIPRELCLTECDTAEEILLAYGESVGGEIILYGSRGIGHEIPVAVGHEVFLHHDIAGGSGACGLEFSGCEIDRLLGQATLRVEHHQSKLRDCVALRVRGAGAAHDIDLRGRSRERQKIFIASYICALPLEVVIGASAGEQQQYQAEEYVEFL